MYNVIYSQNIDKNALLLNNRKRKLKKKTMFFEKKENFFDFAVIYINISALRYIFN